MKSDYKSSLEYRPKGQINIECIMTRWTNQWSSNIDHFLFSNLVVVVAV
jgi:hypothetical protein